MIPIVGKSPKENKGAPVTMTEGTPICGREARAILRHLAVFERKFASLVKFSVAKQIRQFKSNFSSFADVDWRSVGDRPVKVEKEAALFRQKKEIPRSK